MSGFLSVLVTVVFFSHLLSIVSSEDLNCEMTNPTTATTDHEDHRSHDEETPLLANESAYPDSSSEGSSEGSDDEPQERAPSWYIWRVLWLLAGLLIVALFVKGWVDADGDVEASLPIPCLAQQMRRIIDRS